MIVAGMEDRLPQERQQIAQDLHGWGTAVVDWATNRYTSLQDSLSQTTTAVADWATQTQETRATLIHKSSDFLTHVTGRATDYGKSLTDGAIATMTSPTHELIQQPRQWMTSWVDTIQQNAVNSFATDWLNEHPTVHWMVDHPLGTVAIALVLIFLLAGLFRAIAYMTERLWLAILQAPIRLGQWVWRSLFSSFRAMGAIEKSAPSNAEQPPQRERLTQVLQRLDAIKQEQDQLLKELQELLE